MKKLSSRFGTYTQKDGKVFNKISNPKALYATMLYRLGERWYEDENVINSYGPEQLQSLLNDVV